MGAGLIGHMIGYEKRVIYCRNSKLSMYLSNSWLVKKIQYFTSHKSHSPHKYRLHFMIEKAKIACNEWGNLTVKKNVPGFFFEQDLDMI